MAALPPLVAPVYRADVVDLWPRVLSITASGTPTQGVEQEANLAKAGVARELAAKVAGDAAIADLVAFLRAHDPDGAWFSGSNRARDLGLDDDLAIGLVVLAGEWEGSGARERQVGLALHLAAAAEFDVGVDALPADGPARATADQLLAAHGPALRMFLRLQYERTQAFVAEPVVAFRGVIMRDPPRGPLARIQPLRAPLSSFSLDGHIGESFPMYSPTDVAPAAYVVLMAQVPPERILTTPVTGFASLHEQEIVVVGASAADEAWCFVGADGGRVALGSTDAFWQQVLAAAP